MLELAHTIVEYLFLQHPQKQIFAAFSVYLLVALLFGWTLRRPLYEGLALGFLNISGCADLALYLSRHFDWSLGTFSAAGFAITILAWVLMRRILPFPEYRGVAATTHLQLAVGATLALAVWVVQILTPEPSAGFTFFQPWYPMYIEGSIAADRLLTTADMALGDGVVTVPMVYAVDTLGISLLLSMATGIGAHGAYAGSAIAASIFTVLVLLHALGPKPLRVVLYLGVTLIFLRYGNFYRLMLGNNWGDMLQFLSGALACSYLVRGGSYRNAYILAVIAAAFGVFSRNYGIYFAFFIAVTGLTEMLLRDPKRISIGRWSVVATVAAVLSMRELAFVLEHGIYYPKVFLEGQARDWSSWLQGVLTSWGLIANPAQFALRVPVGWVSFLLLGVALFVNRRRIAASLIWTRRLLVPLLIPLAPFSLELITGYQTGPDRNKLYAFAVFFFAWYPVFLIGQLKPEAYFRRLSLGRRRALTGIAAVMVLLVGVFGFTWLQGRPIAKIGLASYIPRAFDSYRDDNWDLMIAEALRDKYGADVERIRQRKIMYFYTEPGIGVRYFLGSVDEFTATI